MNTAERDFIEAQCPLIERPVPFSAARHLAMIQGWGYEVRVTPDLLGNGLIVEGVCSGFLDRIGSTRCGLFYGLISNPSAPMTHRIRAMTWIARLLGEQAKATGIAEVMAMTHIPGVESLFAAQGILPTGDKVLAGIIK